LKENHCTYKIFAFAGQFVILDDDMNIPKTIIVVGRSGSGKGTQINLLKEYIQTQSQSNEVYHFESGKLFRDMITEPGYTSDRIRKTLESGELVPDVITDWLLIDGMKKNISSENDMVIFDGYPRTLHQADFLNQALRYYHRDNAVVIHIDVSEDEVRTRMQERGRADDTYMEIINTRISWYNENVVPTLEYLRAQDYYTVIDIKGEGEISTIHEQILTALANLN